MLYENVILSSSTQNKYIVTIANHFRIKLKGGHVVDIEARNAAEALLNITKFGHSLISLESVNPLERKVPSILLVNSINYCRIFKN